MRLRCPMDIAHLRFEAARIMNFWEDVVIDEHGRMVERVAQHEAEVVSHVLALTLPDCAECGQRSVLVALSVTDPDDPYDYDG